MRWFRIRKDKKLDAELRKTFERYGVIAIQVALAASNTIVHEEKFLRLDTEPTSKSVLSWLTEQHDRTERKETWSITMEAAITIFVGVELFLSLVHRCRP